MSRVTVQNLEKGYGGHDLFVDLSFDLAPGMRLAVAGPNGCGKSTLLKVMAGEIEADSGQVSVARDARLGYVRQELEDDDLLQPLLSWVLAALPSWNDFWDHWKAAVDAGDNVRLEKLSRKQEEFEHLYGYNPDHRARTILSGLGFHEDDLLKRLGELSGGWRERAKLGRVLLQGADVLLLDEPTNHLDLEAVEWLEGYLRSFKGALAFVAHDRIFLERVGTHVLFMSRGRSVLRKGSFTEYLAWEEENARLRSKEAAKLSAKIDNEMSYIRRFRVKARKAAQAQSKLKKVAKLENDLSGIKEEHRVSRPDKALSFKLPEPDRGDKVVIQSSELKFSYGKEPSIWPGLDFQVYRGRKIALAAPNGAGKTTLLKLIIGEYKPTSGVLSLGNKTRMGYFSQHQAEILRTENSVLSEIRRLSDPRTTEEELMGVLGLFMLGEQYFERKVQALSGGEKNRLILASLFLARPNLLILDEPTNHLDLESRMGLVEALKNYEGTLFFVAHDRYLLGEVAQEVWSLTTDGLIPFMGGFEEYDQWRKRDPETPEKDKIDEIGSVSGGGTRMTKEEKRRQAELRNQLYRKIKPLKKEYEKLESDLEKALEDQAELEEKMNDPSTYDKPEEALKLNNEYKGCSEWVESLMERMAGIEEQMEGIKAEVGGDE